MHCHTGHEKNPNNIAGSVIPEKAKPAPKKDAAISEDSLVMNNDMCLVALRASNIRVKMIMFSAKILPSSSIFRRVEFKFLGNIAVHHAA